MEVFDEETVFFQKRFAFDPGQCRRSQAVFRGEAGETQAHEVFRIANQLHLRVGLVQSKFFALQRTCVRRGIAFRVSIRIRLLFFSWDFHIEAKRSVSTSPARGNTVDGLPRASKLNKGCQKIGYFGAKNGNISRSVNSFGTRAIFRPSSGHDLSRNAFVSRFLFPERNSDCSKDFCMTHKMTKKNTKNQIFLKVFGIRRGGFRDGFKALWEFLKPVGMISQDARQKLKNRSFW